jgi:hypothetical protein
VWGFTLTYLAVLGMIIVVVMPFFDDIEHLLVQFLLVPVAVVGVAFLIAGRLKQRNRIGLGEI